MCLCLCSGAHRRRNSCSCILDYKMFNGSQPYIAHKNTFTQIQTHSTGPQSCAASTTTDIFIIKFFFVCYFVSLHSNITRQLMSPQIQFVSVDVDSRNRIEHWYTFHIHMNRSEFRMLHVYTKKRPEKKYCHCTWTTQIFDRVNDRAIRVRLILASNSKYGSELDQRHS